MYRNIYGLARIKQNLRQHTNGLLLKFTRLHWTKDVNGTNWMKAFTQLYFCKISLIHVLLLPDYILTLYIFYSHPLK